MTTTFLTHNKIRLALHEVRGGEGRPLLLLHGLGEQSPREVPAVADGWTGPVMALDFTGHGESTVPAGGGYSAEILLADADVALAHLGEATVLGRGIGGYIGLMLAGARPAQVRGTVICDGPGLWGGATGPTSTSFVTLADVRSTPDPYALLELSRDLRPRDYASLFARLAVEHSGLEEPITVATVVRPPWLDAVIDEMGVVLGNAAEALATYCAG